MRLVVVEDRPDLSALYQVLLAGHTIVATFASAQAAQAWTGWDTVQACITDNALPGMKGGQLLTWLRDAHPDVRRVLVSAWRPNDTDRADAQVFADKLAFVNDVDAVLAKLP